MHFKPPFSYKHKEKMAADLLDMNKIQEQTPTTKLQHLIFLIAPFDEKFKAKNIRIYS